MSSDKNKESVRKRRSRLVALSLCVQCGQEEPAATGQTRCVNCKTQNISLVNLRIENGLCMNGCGRPLASNRKCEECRADYSRKAGEKRKAFVATGMCGRCGKNPLANSHVCLDCYSRDRDNAFGLAAGTFRSTYADIDKCQACNQPISIINSEKWKTPHLDHNHTTGKVRGLICRYCNHAIGFMNEDPDRLRLLADYLEKHKSDAD